MAGLVQAGYLTSSILCIGEFLKSHPKEKVIDQKDDTFRLPIRSCFSNHCKAREYPWYSRSWLWCTGFFGCCWLPPRGYRTICGRRCNWRYSRCYNWETCDCNGTAPNCCYAPLDCWFIGRLDQHCQCASRCFASLNFTHGHRLSRCCHWYAKLQQSSHSYCTNLSISGGITFTGSIVAFLKLAAKMSSRPLALPGKHLVNSTLLGANAATMAGFLTTVPSTPMIAASFLGASTILSFIKGYTTTAAIGGADMRTCSS